MSQISIELGDGSTFATCECCGARAPSVIGYVYRDESAYAAYYAGWTEGHPRRRVSVIIGLGRWDDEASPADRRAFGLRCWEDEEEMRFEVQEPAASRYRDVTYMGRLLPRAEALADPEVAEVFHVAEHIAADDPRVRAALKRLPPDA